MFGIQLRRASLSAPINIVEEYNRKSKKEFPHFIDIALDSLAETEYLIEFEEELGYVKINYTENIRVLIEEVRKILWGLQKTKRQLK